MDMSNLLTMYLPDDRRWYVVVLIVVLSFSSVAKPNALGTLHPVFAEFNYSANYFVQCQKTSWKIVKEVNMNRGIHITLTLQYGLKRGLTPRRQSIGTRTERFTVFALQTSFSLTMIRHVYLVCVCCTLVNNLHLPVMWSFIFTNTICNTKHSKDVRNSLPWRFWKI